MNFNFGNLLLDLALETKSANRGDDAMLTERQLLILQTIIDDFIGSAQPVGSRTWLKKKKLRLVQLLFEMKWLI